MHELREAFARHGLTLDAAVFTHNAAKARLGRLDRLGERYRLDALAHDLATDADVHAPSAVAPHRLKRRSKYRRGPDHRADVDRKAADTRRRMAADP